MKVFVDTNVFVYVRDSNEPVKQRRALAWIEELWATREGRLSTQVLNEYYHAVTRRLRPGMPAERARADVERLMLWGPLPVDEELIRLALEIGSLSPLSHWDALIIAAAQRANCRTLLSEDLNDGQEFGSVRVVNPFVHNPPAR